MSEHSSKHTAGWYIGVVGFWLTTAWIVTAGLSSIIPQIFPPEPSGATGAGACAPELRELRRELLAQAATSVGGPSDDPDRPDLEAWLDTWDGRLTGLRATCSTKQERKAHRELARLRHGMRALIKKFDEEQVPRIRKMEKLLGPDAHARAR